MPVLDFETHPFRSGVVVKGVADQYADGKMANVYTEFIGDINKRTAKYKTFLIDFLKQKGCKRILDVACGTGIDSIMLLEEGFEVVSTDGSDKMLKSAFQTRWHRRKEPAFDRWVIREANWLHLYDEVEDIIGDGFDAVICFFSSFAHLLDSFGDQREQKQALRNFEKCLKPGGVLLIDHRNYDQLLSGTAPTESVFYADSCITNTTTSVLSVRGKSALIIRDYILESNGKSNNSGLIANKELKSKNELRLMFYPHKMEDFKKMLVEIFGTKSTVTTLGDLKNLEDIENPSLYMHIVQKG